MNGWGRSSDTIGLVLPPLSESVADAAAIYARADDRRAQTELVTYEQVAQWLSVDVRQAIEKLTGLGWHGLPSGVSRHRERREPPCRDCRDAFREAQRRRRRDG